MKRIRLYINGERFVIAECEGAAEIWRERDGKSYAGERVTMTVGRAGTGLEQHVELKVESVE